MSTELVTTPPPIKRSRDAAGLDAAVAGRGDDNDDNSNSNNSATAAAATPAAAMPEPANGLALGVTVMHPMQAWVPMAAKTDKTLTGPWSKPPRTSSPSQPTPQFVLIMLDLSPSMAIQQAPDPAENDNDDDPNRDIDALDDEATPSRCAAAAVVDLIKQLPSYLESTLSEEQRECTHLAIAAFSGTAGWVDQDHCKYQTASFNSTSGNWVKGAALSKIEEQSVAVTDKEGMDAYLKKWIAKTERVFKPPYRDQRDIGRGTNIEAALLFAHKVVEEYCNARGGSAQVFLATDGQANIGETKAHDIRMTLDEAVFDEKRGHAVPLQVHSLMMGDDPNPAMLTKLMGSRGLLGYAKDANSIASGLDAIFKLPFAEGKGTFDMITFVSFEDVETGQRVSDLEMTCYSQGQFVVDNHTALYGARMPDKYRRHCGDHDGGPLCPTEEELSKMVVRVVGFCAPNLLHALRALKEGRTLSNEDTMLALLDDGHEVLLDKRIPFALDKWWAPSGLCNEAGCKQLTWRVASGADDAAAKNGAEPEDPFVLPSGEENPAFSATMMEQIQAAYDRAAAGPETRTVWCTTDAKETSSNSLYCWVERGQALLEEINTALGSARDFEEARKTSDRYARMATSSGYTGMAKRMCLMRDTSEKAARRQADLCKEMLLTQGDGADQEQKVQRIAARRMGSARHAVTAQLSQTPADDNYEEEPCGMSVDEEAMEVTTTTAATTPTTPATADSATTDAIIPPDAQVCDASSALTSPSSPPASPSGGGAAPGSLPPAV